MSKDPHRLPRLLGNGVLCDYPIPFDIGPETRVTRRPATAGALAQDAKPRGLDRETLTKAVKRLVEALDGDCSDEELRELAAIAHEIAGTEPGENSPPGTKPVVKAKVLRWFFGLPVDRRLSSSVNKLADEYLATGREGSKSRVVAVLSDTQKDDKAVG